MAKNTASRTQGAKPLMKHAEIMAVVRGVKKTENTKCEINILQNRKVCEIEMSEERIELLKKALALYGFAVEQRREYEESNEFFCMVEELSQIIGIDLHS